MGKHRKGKTSVITTTEVLTDVNSRGSRRHYYTAHPIVGKPNSVGDNVNSSRRRAESGKRPYLVDSLDWKVNRTREASTLLV